MGSSIHPSKLINSIGSLHQLVVHRSVLVLGLFCWLYMFVALMVHIHGLLPLRCHPLLTHHIDDCSDFSSKSTLALVLKDAELCVNKMVGVVDAEGELLTKWRAKQKIVYEHVAASLIVMCGACWKDIISDDIVDVDVQSALHLVGFEGYIYNAPRNVRMWISKLVRLEKELEHDSEFCDAHT